MAFQRQQRCRRSLLPLHGYYVLVLCLFFFVSASSAGRRTNGRRQGFRRGSGVHSVRLHGATEEANPKLDHITFDPLVADMEARADDSRWEQASAHDGARKTVHPHDQPSDDHRGEPGDAEIQGTDVRHEADGDLLRLNVTARLEKLFPFLDADPRDGYVSMNEIMIWQILQGHRAALHRTRHELQAADANGDGKLSLEEYLADTSPYPDSHAHGHHSAAEGSSGSGSGMSEEEVAAEKTRFAAADFNKDRLLDENEFNDLLHPEDSSNEKLMDLLKREEMKHRDTNGDNKLSFQEWMNGTFQEVADFDDDFARWDSHRYAPHPEDPNAEPSHPHLQHDGRAAVPMGQRSKQEQVVEGRKRFSESDLDKDGYIDVDEFDTLLYALLPGQHHFAEEQAKHFLTQADKNKDKHLSLQEMIDNWQLFYEHGDEDHDNEMIENMARGWNDEENDVQDVHEEL